MFMVAVSVVMWTVHLLSIRGIGVALGAHQWERIAAPAHINGFPSPAALASPAAHHVTTFQRPHCVARLQLLLHGRHVFATLAPAGAGARPGRDRSPDHGGRHIRGQRNVRDRDVCLLATSPVLLSRLARPDDCRPVDCLLQSPHVPPSHASTLGPRPICQVVCNLLQRDVGVGYCCWWQDARVHATMIRCMRDDVCVQ